MKGRCFNKNNGDYKNYGGRGITVCDKWLKLKGFVEDMGDGYKKGLQLDRIDNNGNYCKENCRWATKVEQMNNTRRNTKITLFGITKNIGQWCTELKLKRTTVMMRLYYYNWDLYKSFNLDVNKGIQCL